jgi:hypothetical protein
MASVTPNPQGPAFTKLTSGGMNAGDTLRTLPKIARGVAYGVQRTHAGWQSGLRKQTILPAVTGGKPGLG